MLAVDEENCNGTSDTSRDTIIAMQRRNVSSGSPYETTVGFSRAVRIGNTIAVAGTAPIAEDGTPFARGNAYAQTRRCLEIMRRAIEEVGGSLGDVIRTRMMLTDLSISDEVSRAHGEVFGKIRPAATMVEVSRLIEPEWLVEIEADCVIAEE